MATRKGAVLALLLVLAGQGGAGRPMENSDVKSKEAAFGAGCFWGVEKIFSKIPGVISTEAGYAGGKAVAPTYEQVCAGWTGHAEAVKIVYDPARVRYEELLATFWEWHDPTTLNRQGPDVGTQYRSVIFTYDEEQARLARRSLLILEEAHVYPRPIVTQIVPAGNFYKAEEYHQQYLQKNPGGYCSHHLVSPKIRQVLSKQLK